MQETPVQALPSLSQVRQMAVLMAVSFVDRNSVIRLFAGAEISRLLLGVE
jgi:hypothetical protein